MGDRNLKREDQGLEDAESHFKEACEIFMREAKRLRQEQKAMDSMSEKLEHVHFSWTVKLNVGGHHFTTSLQTLTKDPNSMLAAMFSGKFERLGLLRTERSLSTETELTSGLYSIISVTAS